MDTLSEELLKAAVKLPIGRDPENPDSRLDVLVEEGYLWLETFPRLRYDTQAPLPIYRPTPRGVEHVARLEAAIPSAK